MGLERERGCDELEIRGGEREGRVVEAAESDPVVHEKAQNFS